MVKAILRTNNFNDGLEIVDVVKNPISEKNKLASIIKDGVEYFTGGILIDYDEKMFDMLNVMSNKEQWDFLYKIKCPKCSFVA